jgi:hypothetical protein
MAVDRALMPSLMGGQSLEVPIQDANESVVVELPDGGVEISLSPEPNPEASHGDNLAEFIDNSTLGSMASELVTLFDADKDSRKEWETTYIKGLDLLGLKIEDRTQPWEGACGVFHPMLSEAIVRFQAQSIQEIFPAKGPVQTKILGQVNLDRVQQAERVQEYLNYLLTEKMSEYRSETEKLLFSLALSGAAFRKVYYDPSLGRPASIFVPAEDFVVSYGASDLVTCERATHVMKKTYNEIRKLQVSGFYRDVDLPPPSPDITEIQKSYDKLNGESKGMDLDSRYTLLEMVVDYDLPGFEDTDAEGNPTGIALPYVVTIDKSSRIILSIRRNWYEDDPLKKRRQHFVQYTYIPGLGFYGFGLVHLVGGLAKSSTSILRQLVDAGTLSNLPGGLKTRGLRIKGDDTPIMPGEFRDVDIPSGALRDNITFLPYKEPSGTLYQLLGNIVDEGRRFASQADMKVADMNGEAPVGTTLAIIERSMKVMSAVQARLHASMKKELKLLAQVIFDYGPTEYPYDIPGKELTKEDFDDRVDVIPVSDPNAGTMAQRIMKYQAALQLASQAPQLYDLPMLHRQMIEALGIADSSEVLPNQTEIPPTDPVTENMNALTMKPIKAFIYQDHEAHIQTHMSFGQDPRLQQMLQQAPQAAQAMQAALTAHVSEHLAFAYRQQIEKELGFKLPPPGEPLPEDIEYRISALVAPAAAQVTGKAQREAQMQEQQQQQQDPVLQMEMQKLQLRAQEIQQKAQAEMARVQADMQKAQMRMQSEKDRLKVQERIEGARLGVQIASTNAANELQSKEIASRDKVEGAKLGVEIARNLLSTQAKEQEMRDRNASRKR